MQARGFVTISDHRYFPGVRALINSIRANSPAPVTVIDEGLLDEQREWLAANGVETRRVERSIPVDDQRFGCCYALFDLDAAPYERIICIDPDALVLHDIRPVFQRLDDAPIAAASSNLFRTLPEPAYRRKLRHAFPQSQLKFLLHHPRQVRNLIPSRHFSVCTGVVAARRELLPEIRTAAKKYERFYSDFRLPDQDLLSLCLADLGADCVQLPYEMNAATLHCLPGSALADKSLNRKYRWVSQNIEILNDESGLWIQNRDGTNFGDFHLPIKVLHYAGPDKPWLTGATLRPGFRELWQHYHDLKAGDLSDLKAGDAGEIDTGSHPGTRFDVSPA